MRERSSGGSAATGLDRFCFFEMGLLPVRLVEPWQAGRPRCSRRVSEGKALLQRVCELPFCRTVHYTAPHGLAGLVATHTLSVGALACDSKLL